MQCVFNTLFHDIVSFSGVSLLVECFIRLPRIFLEKLAFLSYEAFLHKRFPFSPTQLLCFFIDEYLSLIHIAYLELNLEALS